MGPASCIIYTFRFLPALFQSILDRSTCQLDQSLIIILVLIIIRIIIILLICAVRGHLIAVSFLFLVQCRNKN